MIREFVFVDVDGVIQLISHVNRINTSVMNELCYLLRSSAPNEGAGYNYSENIKDKLRQREDTDDSVLDGRDEGCCSFFGCVSTFFIGLNVFDKILSYFLSVMAQYLLPLDCFSCSRL